MIRMVTVEEIKTIGQSDRPLAARSPYYRVLRKVSPYFTKFFVESNISANQISSCSIMLGIIANFMFALGNHHLMLIGCVIYQFWYLFDIVDGEIARVTNMKTTGGKYLEKIHYILAECGFIASLGIGLSRILNSDILISWGLTFAFFTSFLQAAARSRDVVLEQMRTGEEEKKETIITAQIPFVKRFYKRARLFFVVFTGYLIVTAIVIIELIFPVKFSFPIGLDYRLFGETLTILSTYFFLYGFIWVVRAIVSSVTNFRRIMKD